MGMTTVLYGYIYAPGQAAAMNAACIAALQDDDRIICLTPDLFALPNLMENHSYNDQLITFGTLYKNLGIAVQWPKWRVKFEALLRTMSWDSARVYLDVEGEGRYEYTWTGHRDDDLDDDTLAAASAAERHDLWLRPTERWTFAGGRIGDSEY